MHAIPNLLHEWKYFFFCSSAELYWLKHELGPPVAITQPRPLCFFAAVHFILSFLLQREISAVSRPIATKLCHMIGNGCSFNKKAVLSLFGLKFADNIHYKFKSSQASKARLHSSKHTGTKQDLRQNGHSKSRVLESVERRQDNKKYYIIMLGLFVKVPTI